MIGTQLSAVARSLYSAAALQQTTVTPADSIRVESPLPGGVAETVRFLLNTVPPWIQAGGVVVGAIAAAFIVWLLFVRRRAIRGWLASRARAIQVALVAAVVVLIVTAASLGTATWNYTQHSNEFCTGCHVMEPAFQRFAQEENKHAELSCHDCHQQPISASIRQMYLWIAERPEEIGEHAPVPNQVCEACHVTGDTARWQRVAATAGHRVHLESDSSALTDLQCVSCHGLEVHRFRPVAETCGQSECHEPGETAIVLGKMAGQTVRHCTSCHAFTADVPALATREAARAGLVPGRPECFGCHEMQRILPDFDAAREPHGGTCGTCHNPHEQETPQAAAATCATAGCHDNWRDEPFHVGPSHRRLGTQCLTCHLAHSARVDASDCQGCHLSVRERGRLRPPLPFDTAAALRRASRITAPPPDSFAGTAKLPHLSLGGTSSGRHLSRAPTSSAPHLSFAAAAAGPHFSLGATTLPTRVAKTEAPWPREALYLAAMYSVAAVPRPPPARADTFSHAQHERLACIVCHGTGEGHGRLTFEPPRGCAICHHQAPASARCASCHRPADYAVPQPVTVTVTVPGRQPRPRPVGFLHAPHVSRTCVECHTTPVTLAPPPAKAQCRDCHDEHHDAGPTCASCHRIAEPGADHSTLEVAHQRCDACHTATTIVQLTPTRTFCSTCHVDKAKDHYEQKECSVCHFLAEPGVYRPHLVTPTPR